MMTGKEKIKQALAHTDGPLAVDFGGTHMSGMHCSCVAELRRHYGLEERPVKVCEPYQMLGLIEDDLKAALGIDTTSLSPYKTMFGYVQEDWKPFRTWWGQEVLVSKHFATETGAEGTYGYPEGDTSAPPSAVMPPTSYFFDAIIRQEPLDEDAMDPSDNLEEFGPVGEAEQAYWKKQAEALRAGAQDRAVVMHTPGTALGDIALVPAPFLKHPKGVRDIAEWYMTIAAKPEYVEAVFAAQTEIALRNLHVLHETVGDLLDVVCICGTDFGTQSSTFCAPETFRELWLPHYQQINDWVHTRTHWKTFKHCCGAVETFMQGFIDAGFDIINPVQFNATGMEAKGLKAKYGDRIVFWGGGVNTQQTLPFGRPEEVRAEVLRQIDILAPGGGFVFNAVHNVQAQTPVENLVALFETLRAVR
ncbi:MAG: uroporphyrinogen decarboxylase family protein [Kiritimatiellia bacterium]